MKVTLVQADLHWEDSRANLQMLEDILANVADSDLVVLPEMFNTAFSNNTSTLSETMDGPTVKWMHEQARKKDSVVAGSVIIAEGGAHFNRFIWMRPDGTHTSYDKRHLFRMAGEHEHFQAGKERVIVEHNGWRILLQVCYDLRFPVFSRNRYLDGKYEYDLVLYVANWPSPRHNAWTSLLRARAMENLAYAVGVNRIGKDGNDLSYSGGSAVIDFLGQPIAEGGSKPCILQATLDRETLKRFREKFPTGMDADAFTLLT